MAGAYGLLYGRLNLRDHGAGDPFAALAARVRRIPDLPAFRSPHRAVHAGRRDPEIRGDRQRAKGRYDRADRGLRNLRRGHATRGSRCAAGFAGSFRRVRLSGQPDAWAGVEDSITELFRQTGVRMLRGASVPVTTHGESFNLIGVDFQSPRRFGPSPAVRRLLGNIEGLIDRERVNILLSHNPDTLRPGGRARNRPQPGGTYARRAGGTGIYQPGDRSEPAGDAVRGGLVRQARRSILCQPRDRNYLRADSTRRPTGNHGVQAR